MGSKKLAVSLFAALTVALAPSSVHAAPNPDYALANSCAAVPGLRAAPLSFKATTLGRFVLMDPSGHLVGSGGGPETAGPADEWAVTRAGGSFALKNTATGRTVSSTITPATGCQAFPEAELDASGTPAAATNRDGTIRGFADTHLHVTADMRAGGLVFGGEPFDRFGIVRALGQDAVEHGADGGLDYTGNLLREGVPFGTHDTRGWPTFSGWPTYDTQTHEQVYYRWLQRTWMAGERLIVAETVEDAPICNVEPRTRYSCDETTAIRGQVQRLRDLQDYVDAQAGGPGRGWFRIVQTPGQARKVMRAGKLAVVLGVESSFPLDCRAEGRARCSTATVDRRLDALYRLGIRSLFVAHWADNGFAGAAIEGGVKGKFINALGRIATGHWFSVGRCPDPSQGEELEAVSALEVDVLSQFFPAAGVLKTAAKPTYAAGRHCNVRGLTKLGAHLVRQMMAKGMLIELDHMSEKAREQVLAIAQRAHYPGVISGHSDTGGLWTTAELRRLTALGGIASQRLAAPAQLADAIVARERYRSPKHPFAVGLGTDTGGFASLPGPPADAATNPLPYPFTFAGVSFERQRTGERTFDYNADGVAHYGLLPDLLADMARTPRGARATDLLLRSAQSYLDMWSAAERRSAKVR
jgi:microsomal dipeptidase-like Zn-dependent dipeptidase